MVVDSMVFSEVVVVEAMVVLEAVFLEPMVEAVLGTDIAMENVVLSESTLEVSEAGVETVMGRDAVVEDLTVSEVLEWTVVDSESLVVSEAVVGTDAMVMVVVISDFDC